MDLDGSKSKAQNPKQNNIFKTTISFLNLKMQIIISVFIATPMKKHI